MTNLRERLHINEVDQSELENLLGEYFGSATEVELGVILYPNSADNFALTFSYRDGLIKSVEPGPALTDLVIDELEQKIVSELVMEAGKKIGSRFLFAPVPVTGVYRYKDIFQILPLPDSSPRPKFVMGDHPFLLEFEYKASANVWIGNQRRELRGKEIELILSTLLSYSIRSIGPTARHHWTFIPNETDGKFELNSQYLQEGYAVQGVSIGSDKYADIQSTPKLVEVERSDYYSAFGIGAGDVLGIPEGFDDLLDRVFALSRKHFERFLRASFWLQYAYAAHSYSRSSSFTSLASAIETIMPKPKGSPICPTCGKGLVSKICG